jgi:8-oxo-dGTP pyrophosphatase MutT (NUDIX family)
MDFHSFQKLIAKIQQSPLIGDEAHFLMAPIERRIPLNNYQSENYKPKIAAVNILFYPKNNQTHVLFIKRTADQSVHSGQIAFPGGKKDAVDSHEKITALRELHEEVGILNHQIEVIHQLTPLYIPPSNFEVYPFVSYAQNPLYFKLQKQEVADILEIPLAYLLSDEAIDEITLNTSYAKEIKCPVFKWHDHVIWGATAMIFSEIREMILRLKIQTHL